MKVIFILVIFVTFFAFAYSALARYPKVPGKPGDCWSEETGPMKTGEVKTVKGQCRRASCSDNGILVLASCGVIIAPNGVTEPDLSKPKAGACCPQPKKL